MPTKTRVLIVGGGLGGLVLAILLQKAGISYLVLEQSVLIRPIGSVIALSPLVMPLMEQLGLLEEIKRLSKPFGKITVMRDDLSIVGVIVQVRCSDGSLYAADVLVGADGASSAVRQTLFRQIKEQAASGGSNGHKPLPKKDQEEQQYRQVALVGVTNPLNLKRYPDLKETFSQFKVILSRDSPYMSWFMPILGNRYCWLVTKTLEKPVLINSDNSRESEWGPDATDEMSKAVRHLKGPDEDGQGTVGDLIDVTDRQLISKVMLEERVFKTWYGGRTVLLGDACHKSVPFTGKGASESMLDAVALASLLHDNMPQATFTASTAPSIRSTTAASPPSSILSASNKNPISAWSLEDLHQKVFKPYFQARSPVVREVVDSSSMFGELLVKEGWLAEMKRKLVFAIQDSWMGRPFVDRAHAHRIQATFLKLAPDRGTIPPSQSQVQLVPTGKKGGRGEGRDGFVVSGSRNEEEEEDRYMDMDSPEGRKRLDMQLYHLLQEQSMQDLQDQPELHELYPQSPLCNTHADLHPHHFRPTQHQQKQDHAQVDEFMTGQSSAIIL
ncbi:hypothetical protein EC991_011493 [Linnemannia zychae]|nr:hypothetical protein EC991_011493 [Linnemannia zychae]